MSSEPVDVFELLDESAEPHRVFVLGHKGEWKTDHVPRVPVTLQDIMVREILVRVRVLDVEVFYAFQ
jgi:hypothetical protein